MKTHKNSDGFGVLPLLLIFIVVGIVGLAGWYVWHSNQKSDTTATSSSKSTKTTESGYVVPAGYEVFKQGGIGFVYPEQWAAAAQQSTLGVVEDSQAVVHLGCGDESCAVHYDPTSKTWKNAPANSGTSVVAESDGMQAYLIPLDKTHNCGVSQVMVHVDSQFIQGVLNVCTKPKTKDDAQPTSSQLLYDDVVTQLKEVIKSVNKV